MYYHFVKQRKLAGPCGDMGGFTRLVASEGGKPDGLEAEMPSFFVRQYTTAEIARYGHFGVLNRPFSVVQFADRGGFEALQEQFVYIAETDHVLMRPLPNLATPDKAAAFSFGYMHCGSSHQPLLDKFAPGVTYSDVQPVGPSPLVVSKPVLRRLAPLWLNLSLALKLDPVADRRFGWVLEMWGYSIAAASLGIRHSIKGMQIEPNAYAGTKDGFEKGYQIFHYTYGIEYRLNGSPQGFNTIGEWSLDKRHYGGAYPPPNLDPPPKQANPSTKWLHAAWNEAITEAGDTWPATNAMGTIGWRREGATADEIQKSALASAVVGSHWTWAGIKTLSFLPAGALKTPWGVGKWGIALRPKGLPACAPPGECLYIDFSGAAHHASFDLSAGTFLSTRVGDGEEVIGKRL